MKPALNDTEAQLMSRLLDAEWALMHNRVDEALSQVREANRVAGLACDAAARVRHALAELVRINEEHNAAVEAIMGRPLGWKDSYLDRARDALEKAGLITPGAES